jgi:NAD(P)-dependent dehydrogenase (short-subunit alcohol dehydrogenase family)
MAGLWHGLCCSYGLVTLGVSPSIGGGPRGARHLVEGMKQSMKKQPVVQHLVKQATQCFARVDILVNNMGIIQVGPMPTAMEECAAALDVRFWGVLYPPLAIVPRCARGTVGEWSQGLPSVAW